MKQLIEPIPDVTADTVGLSFPIGDWSLYRWVSRDGFWHYVGRWRGKKSYVEKWRAEVPTVSGVTIRVFVTYIESDGGGDFWWGRVEFEAGRMGRVEGEFGALPVEQLHLCE